MLAAAANGNDTAIKMLLQDGRFSFSTFAKNAKVRGICDVHFYVPLCFHSLATIGW
jgi:DNA polymerase II large subunit